MTLARSTALRTSLRERKCVVCSTKFKQARAMQKVCSPACAATHGRRESEKADRKQTRERKAALKTRSEWLEDVQKVFNEYIRLRDLAAGHGCISCGRHNAERWNAGHFKSVGAHPELRFDEENVHLQCARPCNKDMGGNIHKYRIGLLDRIGVAGVARLESHNEPKKYSISDLIELKKRYSEKVKQLRRSI